jgi:serine protease Do
VTSGGPADRAGLKRGDVIVAFDGREIDEMHELPYLVASTPVGKEVEVEVLRDGKKKTFEVKIGELKEKQKTPMTAQKELYLGLELQELTPALADKLGLSKEEGLVVTSVEKGSPAAEAGLRPGDLILEVDRKPVKELQKFQEMIHSYAPSDTVLFLIERNGHSIFVTLKIQKER